MRRLIALLVVIGTTLSATSSFAAREKTQTREFCAHRQARFWTPGMDDWSDMLPVWELEVCMQLSFNGETVKALQDKPTIRFERYFPFALVWSAENRKTWQVTKENGDLWVHGNCEVSWIVYTPVPVKVVTYGVAQEFTVSPSGYREILYPGWWRANNGEKSIPMDEP